MSLSEPRAWCMALMRSRRLAVGLALVPCTALAVSGFGQVAGHSRVGVRTRAIAPLSDWARAREVPGTEVFSRQDMGNDGKALVPTAITSVACIAARECAVSGGHVDGGFNFLVFVAGRHGAKWISAKNVPGDAALAGHGGAADSSEMISSPFLSQVSCSSPGNCAVAGNYQVPDPSEDTSPLLSNEQAGVWGQAQKIKGNATAVLAISCPAAVGDCAAGGFTQSGPVTGQGGAFVVSEKGGVWGQAQQVPGSAGPVTTMSCPAAGTCLAGGRGQASFTTPFTAFIVTEQNGQWGHARPVPGLSRLTSGHSLVDSVSCAGTGDCAVGGTLTDRSGHVQVFVVDEHHGVWGRARLMPGLAALNLGGHSALAQISCGAAGFCSAGGWYRNLKGRVRQQAWVASEVGGQWRRAEKVPGTTALNTGGNAGVSSVSCIAASCVAGGWYAVAPFAGSGFLVVERHGSWRKAAQVRGLAALNTGGNPAVTSASCARSGWCAAVGEYTDRSSGETRMFVASER